MKRSLFWCVLTLAAWEPIAFAEEVVVAAPSAIDTLCSTTGLEGMEDGPVGVGFFQADFATGRRACPRSEIGVGGQGGIIIATAAFYGDITGQGLVFGSWALSKRAELFATFEAVDYTWVQNAVFKGQAIGLGQLTVGGTYALWSTDRLVLSPSVRLMLPTDTINDALTVGGEIGLAARYTLSRPVELHGYAGVDLSAAIGGGEAEPRTGFLATVGAQWFTVRWFSLVLDLDAHFGSTAAIDYLAPALGFRFRFGKRFGAELSVARSLVGEDLHVAVGALKVTYRW